jgi:hypothetical protein
VRRVALVAFNSAAHNKPSLIRDLLRTMLPHLYNETQKRKELIREVAPFSTFCFVVAVLSVQYSHRASMKQTRELAFCFHARSYTQSHTDWVCSTGTPFATATILSLILV